MDSIDTIKQGDRLLQNLGSFWSNIFAGSGKLQAYTGGLAQSQAQNYLNYLEAVATLSRFTVPVFHKENWFLLSITESSVAGVASIYQPNDLVYGPQTGDVAGRPAGFVQTYGGQDKPGIVEVQLPTTLANIPFNLQNYVLHPTKTWMNGIDYYIDRDRNLLVFRDNPFLDPRVPQRQVFNSAGVQIDTEIAIWIYSGDFDLDYLYTYLGYALGVQLPSSEFAKAVLNAFWDMHLLGPSMEQFTVMLAALAGDPLVINPREEVIAIWVDTDNKLVITDLEVYQLPTTATTAVTVGETVFAGQSLSDAVTVTEMSGAMPQQSILPVLSLSNDFLSGNFISSLTFPNKTVALEYVGVNANGKAVVRFEVSGFPGDQDAFWGQVQTNGELPGNKTLAELLDTRTVKTGQPGPTNLPATINPLKFLLDNLMGNNLFVVRINLASFDPTAPGVTVMGLLREVMPPHINYVVYVQLEPQADILDLGQAGDDTEGGASDSAEAFFGVTAPEDVGHEVHYGPGNYLTYGDVAVYARLVSLTCQ